MSKEIQNEINKIISKLLDCHTETWAYREKAIISDILKSANKVKALIDSNGKFPSVEQDQSAELSSERIRVMIIDDDPVLQKIVKSKLEKKGVEVHSFLDPLMALDQISIIRPQVLLLDLMMPQMTGFEVIQKLKRELHETSCKIIVASGRQFTRDRLQSLEMGADDYLEKPYDVNELNIRIRNLLK